MKTRHIDYIDTAKGIGILSVLIGHIFPRQNVDFIYLFHMPLFFFISGYLLSPQPTTNFITKKTKGLIIPYIYFALIIITLNTVISAILGSLTIVDVAKSLIKSVYGGALLKGDLGAYWFITVLFISIIILNWMLNNLNTRKILLITIAMYSAFFINQHYIASIVFPLGVNICLQAIPLMYIGYLSRNNQKFFKILSAAGMAFLLMYVLLQPESMRVDFKASQYGIPVINTLLSITWIYITFLLSNALKEIDILKFIGSASLTIMFTHQWIHFHLIALGIENLYAILIITLLLSIACHLLFKKWELSSSLLLGKSSR